MLQFEADLQQLAWWVLDVRRDIAVIRRILEDEYGWKIPRRTPEEQAEYDERTRQAEEWMQRAREREAQRQEAVARAGTRRRRLRRFIPFIPA